MSKFKRFGAGFGAVIKWIFRPTVLLGLAVMLIALNALMLNLVSARYATTNTSTQSARVAKFAPEIGYNDKWQYAATFSSLSSAEDLLLPFNISTEGTEVKTKAVVTVTHDGPLPLKYDLYMYDATAGTSVIVAESISSGVPVEVELPELSVSQLELVVSWEGEHMTHLNGLTETMHLEVVCEQIQG